MMTTQSITVKAHLDFHCLAERCPEHCCGSWQVILGEETIERWSQINPESLRERFLQRVVDLDLGGDIKQVLAKNADDNCANLDPDGLCELQSACSHEMLPVTCQDYPRIRIANIWREFKTTELSCPEVVRLLVESDGASLLGDRQAGMAIGGSFDVKITRYLDDLFNLVYAESKYPINVRIYFLASKINSLLLSLEQVGMTGHSLTFTRKQIRNELYECNLSYKQLRIKIPANNAERFWQLAIEMLSDVNDLGLPGIDHSDPLVRKFFSGESDKSEVYAGILALRDEVAVDVSSAYRSEMDKYVPVLFMNRGLPWNPFAQNLIATFINAAIPLALVHLLLWLDYRKHSKMNPDFLQQVIYKVERRLKHTITLYDRLESDLSLLDIHRSPELYLQIA
ncbi:MAG: flagellin lysine-N-methylase [Arenicellales bacterium]